LGKSCGPPDLANGNFNFTTNLEFGVTITFICNPGYRLVGKSSATCVLSGSDVSWDSNPYCEIIPCLPPPETENGQHNGGVRDFFFGMSVTYSCDKGFALIGNATIECTTNANLNGMWSGPAPECKVVRCKNPEVPNGRRLSGFGTEHTYKNTVTFECNPDYSLNGSNIVTCEADSNWKPPLPRCDPTPLGALLYLTHFYLQLPCGPAPHFPFAELTSTVGNRSFAGTKLQYRCKPGYTAASGKSSTVACLDNTTWSADPDFCVQQQCPPATIENGDVIADNFLLGAVVTFSCHPGYELKGSSSAKCVASRDGVDWDRAPPLCEGQLPDVLCKEPPMIDNGIRNGTKGTEFVLGSTVVYKCKDGFTLVGADLLQCKAADRYQGVWSSPAPECRDGANVIITGIFPFLLAMLIMNI
ncbi:Complement receptor type 1, partial [Buceros rhinoceros silvestris]